LDLRKLEWLKYQVRKTDFREFWWDSKLLKQCAEFKDPGLTIELLRRHRGLSNKTADSAHVIRQTIKATDGPWLETLWDCIREEKYEINIYRNINNPNYLPWDAAFILGEIGGKLAMESLLLEMVPEQSHLYPLTTRILQHSIYRYEIIEEHSEPMVQIIDTETGQIKEIPAKEIPDIYERRLLRIDQENEYFHGFSFSVIAEIQKRVAMTIDGRYFDAPKGQIIKKLNNLPRETHPLKKDHLISVTPENSDGLQTGNVSQGKDGRFSIDVDDNSDTFSIIMAMGIIFFDELTLERKQIISQWAGIPYPQEASQLAKVFSIAFLHFMKSIQASNLPSNHPMVKASKTLLANHEPPDLPIPSTEEIQLIIKELFFESQ